MDHQQCSMRSASHMTSSSQASDFSVLDNTKKSQKWTEFEVQSLQQAISGQGKVIDWCQVAKSVPGRTGKQCREKYKNDLNPSLCKEPWSLREEYILARCHSTTGNQWSAIAKFLPRRSDNNIKNHWNSTMRSIARNRRRSLLWLYSRLVQEQGNMTSLDTFAHAIRVFVEEEGDDALEAMRVPEGYFEREDIAAPPNLPKSAIVRSCSNSGFHSSQSESGSYQVSRASSKRSRGKQDSMPLATSNAPVRGPLRAGRHDFDPTSAQTFCGYSGQAVVTGYESGQMTQQVGRGLKRSQPDEPYALPSQQVYAVDPYYNCSQELHDAEAIIRLTKCPKRMHSQSSVECELSHFSEDCSAAPRGAHVDSTSDPLLDLVLNWSNHAQAEAATGTGWTIDSMVQHLDEITDAMLLMDDDLRDSAPKELAPEIQKMSETTSYSPGPIAQACVLVLPAHPSIDAQGPVVQYLKQEPATDSLEPHIPECQSGMMSFNQATCSQENTDSLSNRSSTFSGHAHQQYPNDPSHQVVCDDEYQQLLSMEVAPEDDPLACVSSLFTPFKVKEGPAANRSPGLGTYLSPGNDGYPSFLYQTAHDITSPGLNFLNAY